MPRNWKESQVVDLENALRGEVCLWLGLGRGILVLGDKLSLYDLGCQDVIS